jgi:hypothetical protein
MQWKIKISLGQSSENDFVYAENEFDGLLNTIKRLIQLDNLLVQCLLV